MRVFGFTLLRNGVTYDYPFRESIRSLSDLTEKVFLALGKSNDGTEDAVQALLPAPIVIPTVWDEALRKSGLILSQQTDVALSALRKHATQPGDWGLYLQADEIFLESEYEKILHNLHEADRLGYDAVRFRYLHFWQSPRQIGVNWQWYPQEIRAIRLAAPIETYGDAQSFRGAARIFESDAHVFHYGHVREAEAYKRKTFDFNRWWHEDDEIPKIYARGIRSHKSQKCVRYLGPHPKLMHPRLRLDALPDVPCITVVGDVRTFAPAFVDSIRCGELDWRPRLRDVPIGKWREVVPAKRNPITRLLTGDRTPDRMGSPHARPWTPEFRLMIQLSAKGVGSDRLA